MAENKMQQVAAMNNFDKLLGRNGELVELRKEQVLTGAMHIIQQHYADKQNKMEAVAKLFGRELGEEFTAVIYDAVMQCKFTHNGLKIKMSDGWHTTNGGWLSCLLTGEAEIVEDE